MARRYFLCPPGTGDVNWLEQIETWSQRTKHKLEWVVLRNEDGQYTANIKIDGELVHNITGIGNSPRSARIELAQLVDKSDPAILTI